MNTLAVQGQHVAVGPDIQLAQLGQRHRQIKRRVRRPAQIREHRRHQGDFRSCRNRRRFLIRQFLQRRQKRLWNSLAVIPIRLDRSLTELSQTLDDIACRNLQPGAAPSFDLPSGNHRRLSSWQEHKSGSGDEFTNPPFIQKDIQYLWSLNNTAPVQSDNARISPPYSRHQIPHDILVGGNSTINKNQRFRHILDQFKLKLIQL